MENVAHALAGGLIAAAVISRRQLRARADAEAPPPEFRRTALVVGILAAELPDIDLGYAGPLLGMGKLGYLLQHRGYTHTVFFALISALIVWSIALAIRPALRVRGARWPVLAIALLGTASHLLLDYTNSYGVHPFWPLTGHWYFGDAIFIAEPWLWIFAIPPLFAFSRNRWARGVLALLLTVVIVAAWTLDIVARDVAMALSAGTVLWILLIRSAPPNRRVWYGIAAWGVMETAFFVASGVASHAVTEAVTRSVGTATLRDVVLTPAAGNPLCFQVLVVELDGETYRASTAAVAPWPGVRSVAKCALRSGTEAVPMAQRVFHASTPFVAWHSTFSAPRAALIALMQRDCGLAASMRFMRVPAWQRLDDGNVELSDLRFGDGRNGFASFTTNASAPCPRWIPGWSRPREDILTGHP